MATTSPFKQQCPGCGAAMVIKDPKFIGKKAECPKCRNKFTIEDPAAAEVAIEVVSDTPVASAAKTQAPTAKGPAPAAKPAAPKPAAAPPPDDDDAPIEAEVDEPEPVQRGFSSFKLTCPSCDAPITIKDPAQVNKRIECPRCKYRFLVEPPKGEGEAPAAPAAEIKKPKKRARFGDDLDGKPKPKVASNNMVLFLGISLSVLAIGLLGVGAFFIFFAGGEDPVTTRAVVQTTATAPTGTQTTEPKTPDGPVFPEAANLLLNDTDLVCDIAVRNLYNSIVGNASFGGPGAFRKEQLIQALGHLPEEIDRVVIGYRYGKGNGMAVVRTMADIDLEKLTARLGLEPAADSPIKRQEFFLTRPSSWLTNVRRIVSQAIGLPAPAGKPTRLAVRLVDKRTLVFGDLDTVKEFLELGGQPKTLVKVDPKGPISPRFLTVAPALKAVLDAVQANAPLVGVAWKLEGETAAVEALQKQFPTDLPFFGDLLKHSAIVGMSIGLRDFLAVTFASDLKNPDQGATFESDLRKYTNAISQMGVPTELNSKMTMPPPEAMQGPPSQRPIQKLVLRSKQSGNLLTITSDFHLGQQGNNFVYSSLLRPLVLTTRGISDLAEDRPRIFELANALQAWTKKHDKFPRGTLARKPNKVGRLPTPDQRLSWLVELLPLLGYEEIHKALKLDMDWRPEIDPLDKMGRLVDDNARLATVLIPAFLDPETDLSTWWVSMNSMPAYRSATTHYVGIAGVGLDAADYAAEDASAKLGVFGYDRETALADIKDGLANTIAVLEVPPTYRRPWIAGGGATVTGVPETASIKPFVCREYQGKKGTFAIMADGSVRFIPETITDTAFKALCTIQGGEKIELDQETTLVPSPLGKSELKAVTP